MRFKIGDKVCDKLTYLTGTVTDVNEYTETTTVSFHVPNVETVYSESQINRLDFVPKEEEK